MPNIGKYLLIISVIVGVAVSVEFGQIKCQSSHRSSFGTDDAPGLTFRSISQISTDCVMIAGSFASFNDFFVESCPGKVHVKEVGSIGYVHDFDFPVSFRQPYDHPGNGMMVLNSALVQIQNDKVKPVALENFRNDDFSRILFADRNIVWAVGWRGRIAVSKDGGFSWSDRNIGTEINLVDIAFASPEKGWIVAAKFGPELLQDLKLFQTDDGGAKWSEVDQSGHQKILRLKFADDTFGHAIARDRTLLTTADAGKTWTTMKTKLTEFDDVFFLNRQFGWAITYSGVHRTIDGGQTWNQTLPLTGKEDYRFEKIIFTDVQNGWLLSDKAVLISSDSGNTWKKLEIAGLFRQNPSAN